MNQEKRAWSHQSLSLVYGCETVRRQSEKVTDKRGGVANPTSDNQTSVESFCSFCRCCNIDIKLGFKVICEFRSGAQYRVLELDMPLVTPVNPRAWDIVQLVQLVQRFCVRTGFGRTNPSSDGGAEISSQEIRSLIRKKRQNNQSQTIIATLWRTTCRIWLRLSHKNISLPEAVTMTWAS